MKKGLRFRRGIAQPLCGNKTMCLDHHSMPDGQEFARYSGATRDERGRGKIPGGETGGTRLDRVTTAGAVPQAGQ